MRSGGVLCVPVPAFLIEKSCFCCCGVLYGVSRAFQFVGVLLFVLRPFLPFCVLLWLLVVVPASGSDPSGIGSGSVSSDCVQVFRIGSACCLRFGMVPAASNICSSLA